MRREFHVRFCEGVGVRFPRATRLRDGRTGAMERFDQRRATEFAQ